MVFDVSIFYFMGRWNFSQNKKFGGKKTKTSINLEAANQFTFKKTGINSNSQITISTQTESSCLQGDVPEVSEMTLTESRRMFLFTLQDLIIILSYVQLLQSSWMEHHYCFLSHRSHSFFLDLPTTSTKEVMFRLYICSFKKSCKKKLELFLLINIK